MGQKILYPRDTPELSPARWSAIVAALRTAANELEMLGLSRSAFDPHWWAGSFEIFAPIQAWEAARIHAGHFDQFQPAIRERLEQALLDTCRELRVRAWRQPATAGVYCRSGKVATLGIAVRQGVSSHGLFVNVNPRMDALQLVRSGDGRDGSLAAERGVPVSMPTVRESLIRRLAARLEEFLPNAP